MSTPTDNDAAIVTNQDLRPLAASHPMSIQLARQACRTFAELREIHDRGVAELAELSRGEPAYGGIDSALGEIGYSAENVCLWSLAALKPADESAPLPLCSASHAVIVDGRIFVVAEAAENTRGDNRRLLVIEQSDVLDLTPEGFDEDAPPAPPAEALFTVAGRVHMVQYFPDFRAALARGGMDYSHTAFAEDGSGGAFGFTLTNGSLAPQIQGMRPRAVQIGGQ